MTYLNAQTKRDYHLRYAKMMEDLSEISQMEPRPLYMYKLMDTVIFQDFEIALDSVMEDFYASDNDNTAQTLSKSA